MNVYFICLNGSPTIGKNNREQKSLSMTVYLLQDSVSTYEQVEEENNFSKLIEKNKLVKEAGLYMLDKEVGTRVFVQSLNN